MLARTASPESSAGAGGLACKAAPSVFGNRCWLRASLVAQLVKNLPTVQETPVRSLGCEDHLDKGVATHSSILGWRIPMDRGAWPATVHRVAKNRT